MIAWWTHFGLREMPFGLTPDTQFFYPASTHADACETLHHALLGGEGFSVVSGEVGTGKTLVLRRVLNALPANLQAAFIPNPGLDARGLYAMISLEFGLRASGTEEALLFQLERHFIALAQRGVRAVVLIDEAQVLPAATLEAVRLLTNLETEKSKLLQVVLFGQPELMQRLARPDTRQILTRVSFHMTLEPLRHTELAAYLGHRLHAAGGTGALPFSASALRSLYRASRGLPRLVNLIAAKSMMLAYGQGVQRISPAHVRLAAEDTLAFRLHRSGGWMLREAVRFFMGVKMMKRSVA